MKKYLYGDVNLDTFYSIVRPLFPEVSNDIIEYLKLHIWPQYLNNDKAHDLNHLLNLCGMYHKFKPHLKRNKIEISQLEVLLAISFHDIKKDIQGLNDHSTAGANYFKLCMSDESEHVKNVFKDVLTTDSINSVASAIYCHSKDYVFEVDATCNDLSKLLHDIDLYESFIYHDDTDIIARALFRRLVCVGRKVKKETSNKGFTTFSMSSDRLKRMLLKSVIDLDERFNHEARFKFIDERMAPIKGSVNFNSSRTDSLKYDPAIYLGAYQTDSVFDDFKHCEAVRLFTKFHKILLPDLTMVHQYGTDDFIPRERASHKLLVKIKTDSAYGTIGSDFTHNKTIL